MANRFAQTIGIYNLEADKLYNTDIQRLVEVLKEDKPFHVMLEPGDATRYEVTITPVHAVPGFPSYNWSQHRLWLITRWSGGDPMKSVIYYQGNEFELMEICNGSEHTAEVFHWWFPLIWELVYGS